MRLIIPVFLLGLTFSSCKPTPKPISFGADTCAHCVMTIVDHPFAAEAVSDKGKVFKFDAIECMLDFTTEKKETNFPLQLVVDYNAAEGWLNAADCYFLISEELPSPMGANLSAFKDKASAIEMQTLKGGDIYNWEELKTLKEKN